MPCEYGAFWVQPFEARDNSGSDTSIDAGLCAGKADEFVAGETYSFAWSTHGAVFSFESETSIWLPFCFLLAAFF